MGQVGSEKGRVYFCPHSPECLNKYSILKHRQRENHPNNNFHPKEKCIECGEDGEGKDYWGWVDKRRWTYLW
jgi:hypothetical protein